GDRSGRPGMLRLETAALAGAPPTATAGGRPAAGSRATAAAGRGRRLLGARLGEPDAHFVAPAHLAHHRVHTRALQCAPQREHELLRFSAQPLEYRRFLGMLDHGAGVLVELLHALPPRPGFPLLTGCLRFFFRDETNSDHVALPPRLNSSDRLPRS